jgi:hypothetical protein
MSMGGDAVAAPFMMRRFGAAWGALENAGGDEDAPPF